MICSRVADKFPRSQRRVIDQSVAMVKGTATVLEEIDLDVTVTEGVLRPTRISTSFYVMDELSEQVILSHSWMRQHNLLHLIVQIASGAFRDGCGDPEISADESLDETPAELNMGGVDTQRDWFPFQDLPGAIRVPLEEQEHDDEALLAATRALETRFEDLFGPAIEPAKIEPLELQLEEDCRLPSLPPRRMAPRILADVQKEIDQLLELGVIRPSTSAVCSPLHPVRKSDGSWRITVDYRGLNQHSNPCGTLYATPRMCLRNWLETTSLVAETLQVDFFRHHWQKSRVHSLHSRTRMAFLSGLVVLKE
jgi:hypothetical protein